jgi:hypothetical protein
MKRGGIILLVVLGLGAGMGLLLYYFFQHRVRPRLAPKRVSSQQRRVRSDNGIERGPESARLVGLTSASAMMRVLKRIGQHDAFGG